MSYDTIIVGAGICGLTAAIELVTRGQRVLMLEAESEAGGRAKSITLPNGVDFNLGANWFHGGDKNPFYQWAKARYDLGPLNEDKAEEDRHIILNGKDVSDRFEILFDQFTKTYESHKTQSDRDMSMADVASLSGVDDMKNLAEFWSTLWMAGNGADAISARDFFEDPLGVGGWQMEKGLSHLISQMVSEAQSLGVVINYNAPVIAAKREDDGARAITRSGDLHTASNLIVTASIGVLKSGMIEFDEDVKDILTQRFNGLSMGNFFKMCLPVKPDCFQGNISPNFPVGILDPDKQCFIHARTAGKPTITVFTGGQQARAMEQWEPGEVERFAFDAIDRSTYFKGFRDHLDGSMIYTTWSHHPYYLGAYVVNEPHNKKCDPIHCGSIHFAGEALLASPLDSPGQMAGAWNGGRKVATHILKYS